jgi:signal transduction histidine kinase
VGDGDGDSAGGEGRTLLRSVSVLFADEALSIVRHRALNRLMAVGALGYELKRAWRRTGAELPQLGELGDLFEALNREIGLVSEIVGRRLTPPRAEPRPTCRLGRVLARVGEALDATGAITSRLEADLPAVSMDRAELEVALACVLQNALEAAAPGGSSLIEVQGGVEAGGALTVVITDDGMGLDEAAAAHAFEEFFTTKPGHAGLGLNVARTVLSRWGGELSVGARGDGRRGTRARLVLPRAGDDGREREPSL